MKARSQQLLDRSISAMLAGIEIYNKPMFPYRVESFKAKWLVDHGNKLSCLYVFDKPKRKDGKPGKKLVIRRTASNAPFTHAIEYLAKKMLEKKMIVKEVYDNLVYLQEFRNASVHFYLKSFESVQRLQELGMASVKNYTALVQQWFGRALSDFDFFLMPLALLNPPVEYQHDKSVEEQQFLDYLKKNGFDRSSPDGKFFVAINVAVKFTKTKDQDALAVRISNDPEATKVSLSDDQLLQRYKYSYRDLTDICKKRYSDFVENADYHKLRKKLAKDPKYGFVRLLDPKNAKSSKKEIYSEAILTEFDKHYSRK